MESIPLGPQPAAAQMRQTSQEQLLPHDTLRSAQQPQQKDTSYDSYTEIGRAHAHPINPNKKSPLDHLRELRFTRDHKRTGTMSSASSGSFRSLESPAPAYVAMDQQPQQQQQQPSQHQYQQPPYQQRQSPPPPPETSNGIDSPPRTLWAGRFMAWHVMTSAFMIGCALALIVFACVVARLDGRTIGEQKHWEQIQTICNRLATVFPIVFAIVIGNAARHLAGWYLERGAPLGFIELLVGSNTVGGAVTTVWQLRSASLAAIMLLAVWVFSPLGSQSSLQMVTTHEIGVSSPLNVDYLDTEVSNLTAWGLGAAGTGLRAYDLYFFPALFGIYNTLLMESSSQRNASLDVWGNLRVPDLARSQAVRGTNGSGWVVFDRVPPTAAEIPPYSSLLGLPYLHNGSTAPAANATFTMESSYLSIDCPEVKPVANYTDLPRCTSMTNVTTYENGTYYSMWDADNPGPNNQSASWMVCNDQMYNQTVWGNYNIVAAFGNETNSTLPSIPRASNLMFVSANQVRSDDGELNYMSAVCPLTMAYVESEVLCTPSGGVGVGGGVDGVNCAVVAMRESQLDHPHVNLTELSMVGTFNVFSQNIVDSVGSTLHSFTSAPTEYFLANPDLTAIAGQGTVDWSNLTAAAFSLRFQQVLNTFWLSTYGPEKFTHITFDYTGSLPVESQMLPAIQAMRRAPAAGSASSVARPIYVVRWPWWSIFVAASVVIAFAAAARSALILYYNRGPDVLGFAASVVAMSPYVPVGYGAASTMGGLERARNMNDVRVRMVDVDPHGETGFVAIAQEGAGFQFGQLKKDRLYR